MTRTNRIALFAALALFVIAAGTALANRGPVASDEPALLASSHQAEASEPANEAEDADEGDGDALTRAADRLADHGVEADPAELAALAEQYGVGGAVRLVAWSAETGRTVDEIALMRDGDGDGDVAPMGWGQIARELGVHPGLGSIMGGGNGNGNGNGGDPPGHERKPDSSAGD